MGETINGETATAGLLQLETPKAISIQPGEGRMEKLKARTKRDCKTLYPDGRPGWECGIGWTDTLAKLSYKIECANRLFKKEFRVHAEADQVKEKFGGLRFYYTVHYDSPPIIEKLHNLLKRAADSILRYGDFKFKTVVISPASVLVKCCESSPECDDPVGNRTVLEAPDGFRCEIQKIHRYEMTKRVPTRMRPLWYLAHACYKAAGALSGFYTVDLNRQNIGVEALGDFVDKAVREAENECYSTCEACGRQIGTDYSPRCETTGWITYICEQCAKKRGEKYKKDGCIYDKNGNFLEKPTPIEDYGDESAS